MRIDARGAKKNNKKPQTAGFFFWLNYSIFIKKLESADETKTKAFLSNIRKAF